VNVYFISGLGVDERAFQNISLTKQYTIKHLKWIDPLPNEDVSEYAKRLIDKIDQSKPFALVGLSFGGIVAVEITNLIPVSKTILISSISTSAQLPWYYKTLGKLRIHKITPYGLLQKSNRFFYWAFGAKTQKEKDFFKSMNDSRNINFTKWAIHHVLNWSRKENKFEIIQIHGVKDKLFPVKYLNPQYKISTGTHFMIFNRGEEISEILLKILGN
jgi:pimeloyl-ACP methyl ester carboxylesterase